MRHSNKLKILTRSGFLQFTVSLNLKYNIHFGAHHFLSFIFILLFHYVSLINTTNDLNCLPLERERERERDSRPGGDLLR